MNRENEDHRTFQTVQSHLERPSAENKADGIALALRKQRADASVAASSMRKPIQFASDRHASFRAR
jgi:hypothetical protein